MSEITYRPARSIGLSILAVAVIGSLANAFVALASIALGVDAASLPFIPGADITLTVVAAIGGAIGWHLVNRLAKRPGQVLAWLVPTTLVVSIVPNMLMGIAGAWPLAIATMVMHVVTIVVAVVVFRRLMPTSA